MTVAVNSQPDAPDSLSPNGRTGSGSPVLSWVLGETRIEATQQTAFEVQIDPGEDGATPDWVSGTVVSSVPQLDLSGTTYPGLAGGATTFWRVRVLDGEWSDWSDWAEWTRTAKPGVTVTSPTGGTIYDPSPVVEFSVNTGTMEFFRVIVTPTGQPTTTLYNSGLQDADGASTVVFTIPARDQQNRLVFADDQSYDIEMRAIDLADRVGTPGDPRYVSAVATVTYDDDVNGPITGLFLSQVGITPAVKVRWTRGSAADGWVILRDGKVIARPDHDDPEGGVGIDAEGGWSWVDYTATGSTEHVYQVKALTDQGDSVRFHQSTNGGLTEAITTHLDRVWVIRPNGDSTYLLDCDVNGLRTNDRRGIFSPPGVGYDVHLLTAFEGISGSLTGMFDSVKDDPSVAAVWAAIKENPTEEVRLAYANVNVPVVIYDLTPGLPVWEWWTETTSRNVVEFSLYQSSEFPYRVGA